MEIGNHIKKQKEFIISLSNYYSKAGFTKPCQMFTGSPRSWKRTFPASRDISDTKQYIQTYNIKVFVHSIYLCNLCKSTDSFRKNPFEYLKWELELGSTIGFKGIVVHCGKSLKIPLNKALDNMYNNLISLLPYINPICPILLETSSGQGTETIHTYDSFSKFYNRFTNEEKQKIRICIDTCHIFAAGHNPFQFIQKWNIDHPKSLELIHFNDSKENFSSRKDRHALPGEGFIGHEVMNNIANWGRNYSIPMVVE